MILPPYIEKPTKLQKVQIKSVLILFEGQTLTTYISNSIIALVGNKIGVMTSVILFVN